MNTPSKPLFSMILDSEDSIQDAKNLALILSDYLIEKRSLDEERWEALAFIAGRLLDATRETEAAFDRIVETHRQMRRFDECA